MTVLLRVNEVAEVLACHPITVRRLIKRGLLRPVYVGRALRVSDDEVLRYVSVSTHHALNQAERDELMTAGREGDHV